MDDSMIKTPIIKYRKVIDVEKLIISNLPFYEYTVLFQSSSLISLSTSDSTPQTVLNEVYIIIDANVSDIHPLILSGHLIIYSDKKICIAQNHLMNVYSNLWTNACEAGGKLVGHIPAKEVLYYFNSSPFISSQSSFFTLTEIASKVFLHFKTPEMISSLAKIFPK
ncbi:hypothetical protein RhiirB3_446545 [Rhizophagus irregularis]|nr:hypothetical protein RhiirB3_436118 [Rhizophagus irregularis]PKY25039.1 hypothetical protein RhiirB3_439822 [Rhizophagus irregularis]PKY29790.1 hypothetical protein RhiirB3_446545 [Rhizophagus irregularis]